MIKESLLKNSTCTCGSLFGRNFKRRWRGFLLIFTLDFLQEKMGNLIIRRILEEDGFKEENEDNLT